MVIMAFHVVKVKGSIFIKRKQRWHDDVDGQLHTMAI